MLTDVTQLCIATPEAYSCCNKMQVQEVDKMRISLLVTNLAVFSQFEHGLCTANLGVW